jgi:hypothetical protein
VTTFLSIIPRTAKLLTQLFWMWLTLGWHVRKTRKAFEKELTKLGVPEEDARRLSRQIKIAKDHMMGLVWHFSSKRD